MLAEVISIGDELTSGQRLDTNSQWLSQQLGELGIRVGFHATVGDDLQANIGVFRTALARADLIVCSGGLGPTADDLTREALAQAVGVDLVRDEGALAHIQALFARRQRPMPPANEVQAMFPRGSRIVHNPHGSAPGIDLDVPRPGKSAARVFCLPGVPAEMKEMWQGTVAPALLAAAGGDRRVIRHKCIKCFGVGESDLEQMLPDLIRRGRDPQVGITVSKATITLRVTAIGASPEACAQQMEPTLATIRDCLGDLIYGEDDDELQHAVGRALTAVDKTVATIEMGTAGLLTSWLSPLPDSASFYRGGIVLRAGAELPGLVKDWIDADPALSMAYANAGSDVSKRISTQVAAMAYGCRITLGADFGIAIGPRPTPQADGQPGVILLGLSSRQGIALHQHPFTGHPDILEARTAKTALNRLRLALAVET